jgi:hypothetical protein
MKSFSVGEVRKLVNGVVMQGTDDLLINDVAHYLEKMKQPNMLLF